VFSSSPPRLLHLGEFVSAELPDELRFEPEDSVSGNVAILYSHAKDEEPRSISRPLGRRTFEAKPPTET
jgi:hypothetical protein